MAEENQVEQTTETQEEEKPQVQETPTAQTFTQEELNNIVERRLAKERGSMYKKLGVDDLSIEVQGDDSKDLVRNAMSAHENYGNVATIKLPCTLDGITACKYLTTVGLKVNMTLVFSVSQALLCALAGAAYVSPFVGRMDDNSLDGIKLINDISNIYANKGVKTKVLAASIRDVQSVGIAFGVGADICTVPPSVFDGMFKHVLTDRGLEQFNSDFLA